MKAREALRTSMLADLKKILALAETEGPLQDIVLRQDHGESGTDMQDNTQLHLTAKFQTEYQVGDLRLFLPTGSLEGEHVLEHCCLKTQFTPRNCHWQM